MIVLSDEFYEEVTAHPIPTDLEAVKVLSASPAVLDLFMWLSYRLFFSRKGKNPSRFSVSTVSRHNSAALTIRGPDDSGRCSTSGSDPFTQSGRNAQP
jgi:hypothetical protein